jgi:hypothetical protein
MVTYIKFSCQTYTWMGFLEARDPGRAHRSPCQRDATNKSTNYVRATTVLLKL